MMDMPLSAVAWVAVVLLQAFVHYGFLGGPRRSKQDDLSLDDTKLGEELNTCEGEGTSQAADTVPTSLGPSIDAGYDDLATEVDVVSLDGTGSTEEEEEDTESSSTSGPQHVASSNEANVSLQVSRAEEVGDPCQHRDDDDCGTYDEDFSYEDSTGSSATGEEGLRNPSAGLMAPQDEVDSDDEEEERWRYELLKSYYSPHSSSLMVNNFNVHRAVPRDSYCTEDEAEMDIGESAVHPCFSNASSGYQQKTSFCTSAAGCKKSPFSSSTSSSRKVVSFNLGTLDLPTAITSQ